MKLGTQLLPLTAFASLAWAHATIHAIWINDVDQGVGNSASGYIRSPPNNSPLLDVNSPDLTCNVNGKNGVARTLPVKAGDKISLEWHHQARQAGDQIIDGSHKGPVMVYIAPTAAGTAGNNWVKIAEEGYDASSGKWAVDKLKENGGIHYATIPDIPAGDYLLRGEIIALHEANRRGGAQFYMECIQIRVTSSGTNALPSGVSLPGDYKADHPGILVDIYNGIRSYTIPGPPVWNGAGTPSNPGGNPTTSAAVTTTTAATTLVTVTSTPPSTTTTSSSSPPPPSNSGTAAVYAQCGGQGYTGPTTCAAGSTCQVKDQYYSQCLPSNDPPAAGEVALYQQCGGQDYTGPTKCQAGAYCKVQNPYYHQCVPN